MFFYSHLEFYRYYKMNSTFLDDKLFIRWIEDFHFHLDNPLIYTYPDFSTSLDYLVAEIMANDRLEVFLKTGIDTFSIKSNNPNWVQLGCLGNHIFKLRLNSIVKFSLSYIFYSENLITSTGQLSAASFICAS